VVVASSDPGVTVLNASAGQEEVFRSSQGVSEDQAEAFLLVSPNREANLSTRLRICSSSQLSCALLAESGQADL